ncbi:glycosyltransferase [Marinobacter orientalis]|uniref:Glycosyltransferase n=1 Tax=Marinobacter orientalis TaxID=1928859 RepID=A0A7Y0RCM9_9GAMM|nr:glycosyltransferase [Marinobacter orientalis]NMT63787.1 glycosyltransferase [Marinobacter orientalis]
MPARERILFISNRLVNPYAGTESQLLQLIKHLPRGQFEPRLLVLQRSEFSDSGAISCQVDVLGHSSLLDPRTWVSFWRYARNAAAEGYSLAHIYFHDASIFGPPLLRTVGIRSIISRRDMGYWYNRTYLRILQVTGKFTDKVVVNSQAVGEVTSRKERIPADKIKVIYNGYESSEKPTMTATGDILAIKENGLGPIMFLVANYRPLKRIEDAVRAVNLVVKNGGSAQLVIIGSGNWEPLRQLAKELGLAQRVHFLGGRDDVKECLKHGFIGLLCSESEGYSNSVVEYMQASLPIIVTDVGGNREAVLQGETGYRYPIGDVGALADHILGLLRDPELAKQLGAAGKELADQRHDLQRMIGAHVNLYYSLVGASAAAPVSGER